MRLIPFLFAPSLLAAAPIRGPLWSQPNVEGDALSLWKAALIALVIELLVPLLIFGVNWSFLQKPEPPPPIPVMSVKLDQPPPPAPPRPPQPKIKPEEKPPPPKPIKKHKVAIPLVPPKPLPNEVPSKIEIPKPEPEVIPEPPKPKPKPPEPVPEPPLPSVFRDVKPVKKVKPVYPPEAEQKHVQGHVKVRLDVDVNGNVSDVKVLLADPAGVFEESVLTAVRQYKFKRDGTTYQADQDIIFKIDD